MCEAHVLASQITDSDKTHHGALAADGDPKIIYATM